MILSHRRVALNFLRACAVAFAALVSLGVAHADAPSAEVSKMFPTDISGFRQIQTPRALDELIKQGLLSPTYFPASSDPKAGPAFVGGETQYSAATGEKLLVEMVRFQSDSEAYSLLTLVSRHANATSPIPVTIGNVGTASAVTDHWVAFFRGQTFMRVTSEAATDNKSALELARQLSATLDKGEDDVPVLIKHLPDWSTKQPSASYVVTLDGLRAAIPNQPVLDAMTFEGGTEAVVANYGQAQLVIVEFTTPQFSVDNDSKIWTKIAELKGQNQPTPIAYRRVGNYSVFVFNAPDGKTANALVDQVKYEQVVQWLGDDPHLYERLQRYFTQTSAGVLVAVLKSSGLSLLLCLVAGALIGAMMFRHRRTQKATMYSDAGGSIRLNLDDLTGPANTGRLLKSANSSEQKSPGS